MQVGSLDNAQLEPEAYLHNYFSEGDIELRLGIVGSCMFAAWPIQGPESQNISVSAASIMTIFKKKSPNFMKVW